MNHLGDIALVLYAYTGGHQLYGGMGAHGSALQACKGIFWITLARRVHAGPYTGGMPSVAVNTAPQSCLLLAQRIKRGVLYMTHVAIKHSCRDSIVILVTLIESPSWSYAKTAETLVAVSSKDAAVLKFQSRINA